MDSRKVRRKVHRLTTKNAISGGVAGGLGSGPPFRFEAWLELPFPVMVKASTQLQCAYANGLSVDLMIDVYSDIVKLVTGNYFHHMKNILKWQEQVKTDKSAPYPEGWIEEFVHERDVESFQKQITEKLSPSYFHIIPVASAIRLSCSLPADFIPSSGAGYVALLPAHGCFQDEVFPVLNTIINAYRIAVYPWMRYAIVPLSEAIIDTAVIRFTDSNGSRIGSVKYGFAYRRHEKDMFQGSDVFQHRFETAYSELKRHDAENQISNTYYLLRMRRWTEALSIASAVVDNLTKELIYSLIEMEVVADGVWKAYKFQELFNKVFPQLGLPKLSEVDSHLWADFVEAKQERGARLHGAFSEPYDPLQAENTKRFLRAFYGVSKWLSQQNHREWLLEWPETIDSIP